VVARVMIVEDSRSLRRMIRSVLMQDGHEVLEAEDAEQAFAVVHATPPDLVITDIHMPGMDGLSFVRSLRALPPFRFTPILVLTTEWAKEMKQRGLAAGATGWIVKPFDPQQLCHLVGQLLWKKVETG